MKSMVEPTSSTVEKTRHSTRLFGKSLLKEAIKVLPLLPETDTFEEIKSFILSNLHYNSEQTRDRNANFITHRMFPNRIVDKPLIKFAKSYADTVDLLQVCFYRFIKVETAIAEIIDDLILPKIGQGYILRSDLSQYLLERYPESKSIRDYVKAIIDTLVAGRIVKINKNELRFCYREIPLAAFTYILYSEFPEPGMYDFNLLERNKYINSMLWRPDQIIPMIYELRNVGLLTKVSEIDNIRQFTTKYGLEKVVDRLEGK